MLFLWLDQLCRDVSQQSWSTWLASTDVVQGHCPTGSVSGQSWDFKGPTLQNNSPRCVTPTKGMSASLGTYSWGPFSMLAETHLGLGPSSIKCAPWKSPAEEFLEYASRNTEQGHTGEFPKLADMHSRSGPDNMKHVPQDSPAAEFPGHLYHIISIQTSATRKWQKLNRNCHTTLFGDLAQQKARTSVCLRFFVLK